MTPDPINAYASQSSGFDAQWRSGQILSANVSTRTIGMQLGKLGVSLSTQNISFAEEPAPKILKDFAQELEQGDQHGQHAELQPAGLRAQRLTHGQRRGLAGTRPASTRKGRREAALFCVNQPDTLPAFGAPGLCPQAPSRPPGPGRGVRRPRP